ncbi:MAG: hypothetical protein IPK63_17160 [Candidatus Competibacteraceae bacterium]|nr:hypothetical protein [Candidatus Competibacteraceae bacterium]
MSVEHAHHAATAKTASGSGASDAASFHGSSSSIRLIGCPATKASATDQAEGKGGHPFPLPSAIDFA